MSAPTQITVTFISTPPSTTSTVSIPVPASLANLDSGQTAAGQTGYQSFDTLISGIAKRGGVTYTDASGVLNWIPVGQIVKIVGA